MGRHHFTSELRVLSSTMETTPWRLCCCTASHPAALHCTAHHPRCQHPTQPQPPLTSSLIHSLIWLSYVVARSAPKKSRGWRPKRASRRSMSATCSPSSLYSCGEAAAGACGRVGGGVKGQPGAWLM
jgi:hypothetical protein